MKIEDEKHLNSSVRASKHVIAGYIGNGGVVHVRAVLQGKIGNLECPIASDRCGCVVSMRLKSTAESSVSVEIMIIDHLHPSCGWY